MFNFYAEATFTYSNRVAPAADHYHPEAALLMHFGDYRLEVFGGAVGGDYGGTPAYATYWWTQQVNLTLVNATSEMWSSFPVVTLGGGLNQDLDFTTPLATPYALVLRVEVTNDLVRIRRNGTLLNNIYSGTDVWMDLSSTIVSPLTLTEIPEARIITVPLSTPFSTCVLSGFDTDATSVFWTNFVKTQEF